MSEPEQEPTDEPEAPQEPLQGDELAPDEAEAEEAEQPTEEPAEEPAPDEPAGMSEKQLEAGRKRLEAEGTRHRNRISEIIGEEANSLVPCPLCAGFIDGLIFPVLPPDDVIEATRVAIGMPDRSHFLQSKHTRRCPDCAGQGVCLTDGFVQGNEAIQCEDCNGSGFVRISPMTGELVAPSATNGVTGPTTFAGVNPDDPAVKELQARGFTVIPPMQPLSTGP